jgi:hypothetical protein
MALPELESVRLLLRPRQLSDLVAVVRMNADPQVMGIVNATPDSFSDGGQYPDAASAAEAGAAMTATGAAIVDVGGEGEEDEALRKTLPRQQSPNYASVPSPSSSLRGAKRRSKPAASTILLVCFAALAMTMRIRSAAASPASRR